jgi:hypothetical protein
MICGGSLIPHVKTLLLFRKQRAVRPLRLQLHQPLRLLRSHRILSVVAKSRIFLPQLIGFWWLTSLAIEAFKNQMAISGEGPYLFPSDLNPTGHLKKLKTVWTKTLRRAKIPYFRIYDLRSAYATRLSAGGVADEWVTQLLRQSDAQVFKKYSQMKLRMKREALEKLNRRANEMAPVGEADAFSTAPLCTEVLQ